MHTRADLEAALSPLPDDLPFPPAAMRVPRGKASGTQRVSLPEHFWEDVESDASPCAAAETDADSGG
jgi:hypothetical protein